MDTAACPVPASNPLTPKPAPGKGGLFAFKIIRCHTIDAK